MLKTKLPKNIKSLQQAIDYLTLLYINGESYHCDDSAHDIIWSLPESQQPTQNECNHLNVLMAQVHSFHPDPCEVLNELNLDTYLMSDSRPSCPKCGSCTDWKEKIVNKTTAQVHHCKNGTCNYSFKMVEN